MRQRITPKFLSENVGRKRVSTYVPRLPQCHKEHPQVDYQNIYQVTQYNTPLSPRVSICKTYINCSQIQYSIQHNKELQRVPPKFLSEKVGRKRVSTYVPRLP